jgi:hypothetical protein
MEYKEIIEPIVVGYFEETEITSIDTQAHQIQTELRELLSEGDSTQQYYPLVTNRDGVVQIHILLVGYDEGNNYIDELQIVLSELYKVSTLNWKGND